MGEIATPTTDEMDEATGPRALLAGARQKQQTVVEVIHGRLTLIEAAGRFRAVRQACLRAGAPAAGPADGESLCRAVIGWVHLTLSDRPERAEAVTLRLEHELQLYLDRSETRALLVAD